MAKKNSLSELSERDLLKRLGEQKQALFNLRFQNVTGQLDDYSRMRQVKREIARIHTEVRAREIAAAEALAQEEMA